jgi:WD40 repeat protein
MSFDFSARDPRIYIAGTEDGPIHKCSTSYSEQYLETYMGHKGPVYNVQWSLFRPGLFLSCSADWTTRLWTEEKESELLIFQSASEQVNDVQWCPTNSTVFGTVTNGGYVEIWDISVSTVKPVAMKRPAGKAKQNCLLFSDVSPVVVCGGAGGSVAVYRLFNCTRDDEGPEAQRKRLDDAITSNVVKTEPGSAES